MKNIPISPLERQLRANLDQVNQQNQRLAQAAQAKSQAMGFSVAQRNAQNRTYNSQRGMGQGPGSTPGYAMGPQGPSASPVPARSQWWLAPGNVGDINQVIWDYFFVIPPVILAPTTSSTQIFTINQVASFTMTQITKAVFTQEVIDGETIYRYLDPDAPADLGFAQGVTVTMLNTSSRQQYTQAPVSLDQIGSPSHPFELQAPLMLQANSSLSVQIGNNNPNTTYVVSLALLGYRLRIQNASQIQSNVTCG